MNEDLKSLTQKPAAFVIALVAWAGCVVVSFLALTANRALTEAWSNASGVVESVVIMMLFACFITFSVVALMLAIHLSIKCFRTLNS